MQRLFHTSSHFDDRSISIEKGQTWCYKKGFQKCTCNYWSLIYMKMSSLDKSWYCCGWSKSNHVLWTEQGAVALCNRRVNPNISAAQCYYVAVWFPQLIREKHFNQTHLKGHFQFIQEGNTKKLILFYVFDFREQNVVNRNWSSVSLEKTQQPWPVQSPLRQCNSAALWLDLPIYHKSRDFLQTGCVSVWHNKRIWQKAESLLMSAI